jgi:hypothetical protein
MKINQNIYFFWKVVKQNGTGEEIYMNLKILGKKRGDVELCEM